MVCCPRQQQREREYDNSCRDVVLNALVIANVCGGVVSSGTTTTTANIDSNNDDDDGCTKGSKFRWGMV